jgi:hypothetical protein
VKAAAVNTAGKAAQHAGERSQGHRWTYGGSECGGGSSSSSIELLWQRQYMRHLFVLQVRATVMLHMPDTVQAACLHGQPTRSTRRSGRVPPGPAISNALEVRSLLLPGAQESGISHAEAGTAAAPRVERGRRGHRWFCSSKCTRSDMQRQ